MAAGGDESVSGRAHVQHVWLLRALPLSPHAPAAAAVQGQATVPPADAQVIFSTVPLWSIAFAFLLLGGEPMSQWTFVGGAAVVAAGLIASRKPEPTAASPSEGKGGKDA